MNIIFVCKSASVTSNGYRTVSVDIEDVEISDILECFNLKDIVKSLNSGELLDVLGMEECMDHFDLIENIEEE